MMEEGTRVRKRFDREYATEWRKERDWLKERGIEPSFVKMVRDGVERYKYRKTAELFENLAVFYQLEENARKYAEIERAIESGDTVATGKDDRFIERLRQMAFEDTAGQWEDDTV